MYEEIKEEMNEIEKTMNYIWYVLIGTLVFALAAIYVGDGMACLMLVTLMFVIALARVELVENYKELSDSLSEQDF